MSEIDIRELFDYPLDCGVLLRKKRKIRKSLLDSEKIFIEKKIAVLGGSTTNEIVDQIDIFLLNSGIKATFYQSDFGRYWQDGVFGTPELDQFSPDIIFIHTTWRNIQVFPTASSSRQEVDEMLESELMRMRTLWDAVEMRYKCPIIQNNFDRPLWRLLGNSDISDYRGKTNFVHRLNSGLYDYADSHSGFFVNDIDYLSSLVGLEKWQDPLYWHMYKYGLSLEAIPYLAQSVSAIIKAIFGRNKKVLACDLDNTLWGGVIGDDGVEGIQLGPEVPQGQVFVEFQSYIKELRSIGTVLAVNSKNDEDNAIKGLRHPDSVLLPEDFADIKANWDNKDRNMFQLASELNLGIDSFVFADDNPVEREIMKKSCPEVSVPELLSPERYISYIDKNHYFEAVGLSADDLGRADMYRANTQRALALEKLGDYSEFLKSLEMTAVIRRFEPIYFQRIAQLTNKSNQFNLTTLRCTESDIAKMAESDDTICLYGKLLDKFGDNGVVSVLSGQLKGDELHLNLWLMSCRVLKRGMEDAMLASLVGEAASRGCTGIVGYYYPTVKNGMVKDFYEKMGFSMVSSDEAGNSVWKMSLSDYKPNAFYINISDEA